MFDKFSRSWTLVKASAAVLRSDKELLVFPLLSGLAAMLVVATFIIPVFALIGQEGKLFHPLAFAKTFAMVGATLLAVTIVPVLCTFWVRGPSRRSGSGGT